MLENPQLPAELISTCVQRQYGIAPRQVTFLPIGYDKRTAVYRLTTRDSQQYFLKLRKGIFNVITVNLPRFLYSLGLQAVIPPISTLDGELFGNLQEYKCILYPFISGRDGYEVKLTDVQWRELGKALRLVHAAHLPPALAVQIPPETYDPQWRDSTRMFLSQVEKSDYTDPVARDLAVFMWEKRDLIKHLVDRADALAASLDSQSLEFVLCHSDAHPGNYLVAESGALYLVDWDTPILAPRERDLMCIGGGMSGDQPGGREEHLFYQGYGPLAINRQALAYYRYERIIQDIAEFCKEILLTTAGGADRLQSFQYLSSSFQPASVVEAALQTDSLSAITR